MLWAVSASAREFHVYFGTYTGAKSRGIYAARLDANTGRLTVPELAAETRNPSFLALHPNRRFLYAVGELSDGAGRRGGAVNAFAVDRTSGRLTFLNQQQSGGAGPCHLAVDHTGRWLLVANYGSGSVAVLPVQPDGSLGAPATVVQHQGSSVNPKRQAGPHAHHVALSPDNRFALVCDLGLDQVLVYQFDAANGALKPHKPPFAAVAAGAGPRHLAFAPNGRFAYVVNELNSTVTAFRWDAEGGLLKDMQTLTTLPAAATADNTCAEVEVHPSGAFVYASNRGHNSLAVFSVDRTSGRLRPTGHQVTGGRTPRHFAIDPTGRWLLAENQDSDSVLVFGVDRASGRLVPTGQKHTVPTPVCCLFVPTATGPRLVAPKHR